MTTWFVVMLVIFGAFKIIVASIPTSVVESLISRFALHPQLNAGDVTVTIDGKCLEDEEKIQMIDQFNEAIFLEKYYFPPQSSGTPVVIHMKKGKNDLSYSMYSYDDHIDVVKQYKKKVVAYSLRSKELQNRFMLVAGDAM
ncbi:YfmQ family protein [Bacillus cereus]|uniref:YfmQ family protein n=1 Tax=Bacillus cereus TaxID=1396 RepID=UPI00356EB9D2